MEEKDQIRLGISALLQNFFITKKHLPEEYMLIKKHKKPIQKYFLENFGYQLFFGIDLFKLEKVPYEADSWMGIQDFKEPMDYSIFVAVLAYLEDKATDDLFLISTLSDYVKSFFNGDLDVKWELYSHRLSFYRAMKFAQEMDLIESLEGELDRFKDDEKEEILYRPTMISKHFMRYFTKPIHEFKNMEEMLEDRWIIADTENTPKTNLQSIHRRLFFSPVVYKNDLSEDEKKYLNYQGYRMVNSIPEYTKFELEIYRNEILLISKERNASKEQHPTQKAISDVVLQFSKLLKEKLKPMKKEKTLPNFEWIVSRREFDEWVETLHMQMYFGWSKEYRKMYREDLADRILEYMEEWKMALEDTDTYSVILYPASVRIAGEYPRDFQFERFFVEKIMNMDLIPSENFELSVDIFEELVKDFNKALAQSAEQNATQDAEHHKTQRDAQKESQNAAMRLKTAEDTISKFILAKDESFIELDSKKIEKTFKGE